MPGHKGKIIKVLPQEKEGRVLAFVLYQGIRGRL
jgi:hypothetical protein